MSIYYGLTMHLVMFRKKTVTSFLRDEFEGFEGWNRLSNGLN